jgi:hypothetical protein
MSNFRIFDRRTEGGMRLDAEPFAAMSNYNHLELQIHVRQAGSGLYRRVQIHV